MELCSDLIRTPPERQMAFEKLFPKAIPDHIRIAAIHAANTAIFGR